MSHLQFVALAYAVSAAVLALIACLLGFSHIRLKSRLRQLEARRRAFREAAQNRRN